MNRNPVQSSNIKSVGYSPATRELEIEFASGVYSYLNVPPEIHKQLLEAKSAGSFFSYAIRGKFESAKVPQEPKNKAAV